MKMMKKINKFIGIVNIYHQDTINNKINSKINNLKN